MTWPLPTFATDWTNATPQLDSHPDVHNAIGDALNEIAARWDALPRGYVGHASPGAPTTSIVATIVDIVGMSVAFTADPTRRYRVMMTTYRIDQAAAAGNVTVRITNAANAQVGSGINSITLANGAFGYVHLTATVSGVSGSQTYKGRISTDAGSCTLQAGGLIIVEDIGKA